MKVQHYCLSSSRGDLYMDVSKTSPEAHCWGVYRCLGVCEESDDEISSFNVQFAVDLRFPQEHIWRLLLDHNSEQTTNAVFEAGHHATQECGVTIIGVPALDYGNRIVQMGPDQWDSDFLAR